jgi:hypothetical protein
MDNEFYGDGEDFHIHDRVRNFTQEKLSECVICCEQAPLIKLMKNCQHPDACRDCLRKIYVSNAQKDVKSYPLKCFDPLCRLLIRDICFAEKGIIENEKEMAKHHRLATLAKAYRVPGSIPLHCPDCDHPRLVNKEKMRFGLHVFTCLNCAGNFAADSTGAVLDEMTVLVLEKLPADDYGQNEGWAVCPKCRVLISKGYGCDHMVCICGHNFGWEEAREAVKKLKIYRIARYSEGRS